MTQTAVIVNPRSGSGRAGALWPKVAAGLNPTRVCFTEGPGHAIGLTRELLGAGYERIVAAGGDGTVNEVLNGFLDNDRPLNESASLALIPLGTGSDLGRTIGIRSVAEALQILRIGAPHPIDIGRISYRNHLEKPQSRYFINVASFGLGGEVAARVKESGRLLSGKAAFFCASLRAFLTWRPKAVALALDGAGQAAVHRITNIAVGNGEYHGGGMHICPRARIDDGLFEITVIDAIRFWHLARGWAVLYSPDLYTHPRAHHYRAVRVQAQATERVSIEVDGEPLGTLPVDLSLLPAAVRIWQL